MYTLLRTMLGTTIHVATPLDLAEGVLVAAEESCLTIHTSGTGGYDSGEHAVFPYHQISYIRVHGQDKPIGSGG